MIFGAAANLGHSCQARPSDLPHVYKEKIWMCLLAWLLPTFHGRNNAALRTAPGLYGQVVVPAVRQYGPPCAAAHASACAVVTTAAAFARRATFNAWRTASHTSHDRARAARLRRRLHLVHIRRRAILEHGLQLPLDLHAHAHARASGRQAGRKNQTHCALPYTVARARAAYGTAVWYPTQPAPRAHAWEGANTRTGTCHRGSHCGPGGASSATRCMHAPRQRGGGARGVGHPAPLRSMLASQRSAAHTASLQAEQETGSPACLQLCATITHDHMIVIVTAPHPRPHLAKGGARACVLRPAARLQLPHVLRPPCGDGLAEACERERNGIQHSKKCIHCQPHIRISGSGNE